LNVVLAQVPRSERSSSANSNSPRRSRRTNPVSVGVSQRWPRAIRAVRTAATPARGTATAAVQAASSALPAAQAKMPPMAATVTARKADRTRRVSP
jgi:hypothetical protein